MKIKIEGGTITVSARAPFAKWLQGWKSAGGWTGAHTISKAWDRARM